MTEPPPPPARRWRFPRKTAWALALVGLIGLGVLAVKLPGARRQQQASAAVRQLGGWIFYDCRYQPSGQLASGEPAGPAWLNRLLGVDFFGTVSGVKLTEVELLEGLADFQLLCRPCPNLTDASLACLEDFDRLEWLALNRGKITDAGLEHLQTLTHLQRLWLDDTAVGDPGLAHLEDLRELTTLSLRGTRTSDAGLAKLKSLTRLQRLRVQRTQCTLAGIMHLLMTLQHRSVTEALDVAGFAKRDEQGEVITLDLSQTRVCDADLAQLAQLHRLQWLHLNGTGVTDAGLVHLEPLANLELLHLGATVVTDEGLKHLQGLKHLRTLHLTGTKVTDAGVQRIQEMMPNRLRIYR